MKMRTTAWPRTAIRAVVVAALTVVGLAVVTTPSNAANDAPAVTVADHPGAPGDVLAQLTTQFGHPLGTLQRIVAFDSAGQQLTVDQLAVLVAGGSVPGVSVLGVMPGRQELLATTLADLSDGQYDGPSDTGPYQSSVLLATYDPQYGWCLTMCVASGKSVAICMAQSRGRLL